MAYTVNDIYEKAKAWMFEKKSSTIYKEYIIDIINKVLAENYDDNNMCRMFYGKVPFIDGVGAHQVSALTDVLDYEDEYLLDVIPKGIDSNFLMDDDLQKMSKYDVEYSNAQLKHQKMVSQEKVKKLTEEAQNAS